VEESYQKLLLFTGGQVELVVMTSVFIGILVAVIGLARVMQRQDPLVRRLNVSGNGNAGAAQLQLRIGNDAEYQSGLNPLFVPQSTKERNKVRVRLIQAGYRGHSALTKYYFIRTVMGLIVPLPLLLAIVVYSYSAGSFSVRDPIFGFEISSTLLMVTGLIVIGFYGPAFWLRRRIKRRQRQMREGFPHALDMLQVAIDAGLGFDAALARVAVELQATHPVMAEEFLTIGLETSAGMNREDVLRGFAERTGVDEIMSFVTIIIQSLNFGTSIIDALKTYAREMRSRRMLAAEEKANKLPVKMSVVMVLFLVPTMFIVMLTPTIIRLIRMFDEAMKAF